MIEERLGAVFAAAGAEGRLHAVDVDGPCPPEPMGRGGGAGAGRRQGPEAGSGRGYGVGLGADDPVVIASVFKVLLVLEFARQVSAGQLDPRERVRIRAEHRLGGWGTAGCADDAELSLRDLAFFALSVSDNTAADLLMERVGLDTVRMLAAELGLAATRLTGGPRQVLEAMLAEVGARDETEFAAVYPALTAGQVGRLSVLDPARTNASTPRDITRLLRLIWCDLAGPADACAFVRDLMARQVFRHRLVSGFPDEASVAAKTGTLPGLHIEAGVVTYPDGGRYAVAVFARTPDLATSRTGTDAAIGRAARIAVDHLRTV
ncbi:serine hydrolase [Streptomyces sp. SP18CS02]|uniref:serine hydrolase n=1 Tax=Streptomyces sp. SP18CS02 TaxID=3002531 RepID=UPI002E790566|nr:serine hydrolase [Streptomyces sp. SP18CS02]MEE1756384.1 class A beta-lactamase-related serine hydrolase [Streptomyces sp. SP18CS02]